MSRRAGATVGVALLAAVFAPACGGTPDGEGFGTVRTQQCAQMPRSSPQWHQFGCGGTK